MDCYRCLIQWGKSTGQTTTFPIAFTVSALNGFTQYNETGNATGNADQTITSLSKTSITTYRGYGYNYWGYWSLNSGELIALATTEAREKAVGTHFL